MKTITLTSNAKVNLALDVLGCEQAGEAGPSHSYHFIQTVLHEITPQNTRNFKSDLVTIQVEEAAHAGNTSNADKHKILIFCDDPSVPTDKSNLAYKAAELIIRQQYWPKNQPALTRRGRHMAVSKPIKITITIEKHIPVAQGFGGGSSNAAATLKGLNELLALNLDNQTLRAIAAEVGMDVPFFIEGGVALGEHFGEQITPLPPVKGLAFTFFPGTRPAHPSTRPARALKKPLSKKTEKAYAALDLSLCGKNTAQTEALIHAIKTNDTAAIPPLLHNDFETLPEYASAGVPANSALPENRHLTGAGPGYFLVS